MPWFYLRPMKFFPKEEPVNYHRLFILPIPFVVEDKATARTVNIIVLSILALGGLVTAIALFGFFGPELPVELWLPYVQ